MPMMNFNSSFFTHPNTSSFLLFFFSLLIVVKITIFVLACPDILVSVWGIFFLCGYFLGLE